MKNIIISLAALLISAHANAEALASHLNVFRIQPHSTLSHLNLTEGIVTVDQDAATIRLQLGDTEIVTPLVKTEVDGCGSTVHTGLEVPAEHVADGISTQIVVKDNTTLICRILLPATEVELSISGGFAGFNEKHEMEGKALSQRYIAAQMQVFNFQAGSALAQEDIQSGHVTVDLAQQLIVLTMYKSIPCSRGRPSICAAVMPMPITISLPLEETIQYRCNVTDYISKVYQAERGGPLHQLKLRVSGSSRCISTMPVFNADVTLEVFGFIHETHHLQGNLN